MKLVVAQLGARMHYAIPRLLHSEAMLEYLFTDICGVKGWPRFLRIVPQWLQPAGLKKLLNRIPENVPAHRITAFPYFGLEYARRLRLARSPSERTAVYLWAGKKFCALILRQGLGDADGIYTFNSAGLEIMEYARSYNVKTIMEQTIAPRQIEQEILRQEYNSFPHWDLLPEDDIFLTEYAEREKKEWELADLILCGSQFVVEGIAQCGGPVEKCVVVPYGVDMDLHTKTKARRNIGPLRVLTVGEVGLRKGSPYICEAAKEIGDKARFRMVGFINALNDARKELSSSIELVGPVARSEIVQHYLWADVFLLPSLCEGSATVIYEALTCGLPVITTPNAGSPIINGVDGQIIPCRNSEAIIQALERYLEDQHYLQAQQQAAAVSGKRMGLQEYKNNLIKALARLTN